MLITRSDISSALIAKFNGGLTNLNVVVDSQNPSGNQLSTLQTGINTSRVVVYRGSGIMHHKFMCIDNFNSTSDPQVLVGSHNWSSSAETKNDENILIVHDANITNQFYQAFVALFNEAGGILSTNDAVALNDNLVLYPNPTKGILTITAASSLAVVDFSVYDVLGNLVFKKHSTNMLNESIDLSGFGSGVYIVGVVSGGNKAWFKVLRE